MKRFYASHEQWEDWQHGLYQTAQPPQPVYVAASRRVLADAEWLRRAMFEVVIEWPISSAVNLTNRSRNRRAWLGQAACCLVCGSSEDETKLAWHRLTKQQQDVANQQADAAIAFWMEEYDAENNTWNERPRCRSKEDIGGF